MTNRALGMTKYAFGMIKRIPKVNKEQKNVLCHSEESDRRERRGISLHLLKSYQKPLQGIIEKLSQPLVGNKRDSSHAFGMTNRTFEMTKLAFGMIKLVFGMTKTI